LLSYASLLQTKANLSKERDEVARLMMDGKRLQDERARETEEKSRIVKDLINAMHAEEQAKLDAQAQLRSIKERAAKLEGSLAETEAKLSDSVEKFRDMEAERDVAQVLGFQCSSVHLAVASQYPSSAFLSS
jgi:hypothetical protein